MKIRLEVCVANKGVVEGEAVVCREPFTFRDVNPVTGVVDVMGHELLGQKVAEKIIVCPCNSGVSTEEFAMYGLKKAGLAPKAIVNGPTAFYISIVGAILAGIPMVYGLSTGCLGLIKSGDYLKVDGDEGVVELRRA